MHLAHNHSMAFTLVVCYMEKFVTSCILEACTRHFTCKRSYLCSSVLAYQCHGNQPRGELYNAVGTSVFFIYEFLTN